MTLGLIKDILARMVAVFIIGASGFISGGAVVSQFTDVQISPAVAALMAGFVAVLDVLVELARLFVGDGKITRDEVNQAFRKASVSDKKEESE
jgi:hypothetical protein